MIDALISPKFTSKPIKTQLKYVLPLLVMYEA